MWNVAHGPKAKAKPAKVRKGQNVQIGERQYPREFPLSLNDDAQWTEIALRRLLPPDDSTLYHDRCNLRWQLFWFQSRQTRSANFIRYGHIGGGQKLLDIAWEKFESLGGAPRPWGRQEGGD